MNRVVFVMLTLLWPTTGAVAQAPPPRFDVVSIKVSRSGEIRSDIRVSPGGRYEWRNATLQSVIGSVFQRYGFDQRQTEGGPDWIERTRFDILVQTGTGTPPNDPDGFPGQLFAMMQAMLRDRFGLVVRNEVRQGPIYRLVRLRSNGPVGTGLRQVADGCVAAGKAMVAGEKLAPRQGRGPDCTFGGPPGQLQGNAVPMDMIARVLGAHVNRPVVNDTGLTGSFDLDLAFSPQFTGGPPGSRAPGDQAPAPSDAPSIFTAVQEQLGLRLETARGPVDVLVVDQARLPAEN